MPAVSATQRLDIAIKLMQEQGAPIVAVSAADGKLAGYVSLENITELLMLDEARLSGGGASRPSPRAGPAA